MKTRATRASLAPGQVFDRPSAADGHEAAELSEHVEVESEHGQSHHDHDEADDRGHPGAPGLEVAVEGGRKHRVAHRAAQEIGRAERPDRAREGEQERRHQGRQEERHDDPPEYGAASRAEHLCRLLQLAVEGAQSAAEEQVSEGEVMEGLRHDDRQRAEREPLGR